MSHKHRIFSVEDLRNTNRDAVAEVRSDMRYIWSGGAPVENFMGNTWKADRNPVAIEFTFFIIRNPMYVISVYFHIFGNL